MIDTNLSLLVAAAAAAAYLSVFTVAYLAFTLLFLARAVPPRRFDSVREESLSIVIPSRDEGAEALHAVDSALRQDHPGEVDVYLLVEDAADTTVPHLRRRFPGAPWDAPAPSIVEAAASARRRFFVAYTGHAGKGPKLNWILRRLETDYIGLLDADNRAHADWARTSLCLMAEQGASAIQSRRWPLTISGFFQLWDSLQHHVGCQVLNVVYARIGLSVCFTGTAAIFESRLLREHSFRDCLTEDTDLSYQLILEGTRIANNPYSGTDEEVSPDLYSFLARRRRWANGHTEAFLRHLKASFSRPLPARTRLFLLLHGQYYLISVLIVLVHLIVAGHLFARFAPVLQAAALAASAAAGVAIAAAQRTPRRGGMLAESLVSASWAFPFAAFAALAAAGFLRPELVAQVRPFPGIGYFQAAGALSLSAPLLLLVAGLFGFGQAGAGILLAMAATFPFSIFWDICGNMLGLADYFLGVKVWKAITRSSRRRHAAAGDILRRRIGGGRPLDEGAEPAQT
ncbi:MAG: glycosyltransferase family 2 protein [Elusimicrobia bacterium]|nr:glycosyltransferase family 2 protein [Elusimicrobiota bacterium]